MIVHKIQVPLRALEIKNYQSILFYFVTDGCNNLYLSRLTLKSDAEVLDNPEVKSDSRTKESPGLTIYYTYIHIVIILFFNI